jgi:DNA polymerase-3 subunit gamma/tau
MLAAEMVLIRLAHAADLPQGEELVKLAQQAASPEGATRPGGTRPLPRPQLAADSSPAPVEAKSSLAVKVDHQEPMQPQASAPALTSFAHVLALADEHRDIKLKNELERFVRPIRVSAGQIELALEQGAPPGLSSEISRKLQAWTGSRWMVLVAREGGELPVAQQRKLANDAALREVLADPLVQAVLKTFPAAKIEHISEPPALAIAEDSDEEHR